MTFCYRSLFYLAKNIFSSQANAFLSILIYEQAMSAYGYEIVQTLIVDIEPDVHVKRAMNEINAGKILQISSCAFYFLAKLGSYHFYEEGFGVLLLECCESPGNTMES